MQFLAEFIVPKANNQAVSDHFISQRSIFTEFGQTIKICNEIFHWFVLTFYALVEFRPLVDDIFLSCKMVIEFFFDAIVIILEGTIIKVKLLKISSDSRPIAERRVFTCKAPVVTVRKK